MVASRLRVALGVGLASAAVGAVAVGAESVGVAQAGQYHVYSCRTPSGASAPADGWAPSTTGAATYVEDTCPQGGALVAGLGEEPKRTANTATATWAFGAPAGESIAGATLWRAGDTDGGSLLGATYQFGLAGSKETELFEECLNNLGCVGRGSFQKPLSVENRVVVPAANLGTHLYLTASCGEQPEYKCNSGHHDANGFAAVVYLYAADITLEQTVGPSATDVRGELATAPSVHGASGVQFDATDPGAGVYAAEFTVDGKVVQSTVLDDNGGRCKNVGANGESAFLYVQPCERSVSVDVPLDTTKLDDGAHHLVVSVLDAAGNRAPVLDRTITVANPVAPAPVVPGPPNGTNASSQATLTASWHGTSRTRIASAYGHAPTIAGRLVGPGGAPIGGAQIDLLDTPAYAGAKPIALASPRTAGDGGFTVRLPHSVASGRLTLAYRARLDEEPPVAARTLGLSVRAGITLKIAPRATSVGHSIRFAGELHGAPIPVDGKQLVLEARSSGSGWIEFDVIRTNARGRFHSTYRFKFPGPAHYSFRVVSNAEADFPFATGASSAVGVYER